MLKDLNFVYFVDNNNLEILKKSVETLIKFYEIHLLTIFYDNESIEDILIEYIDKLKNKYNKNFDLQFKYIDTKIASMILKPKNAINNIYLGNNALIRFFLPYLLDCENVYWVDNDILFNKNYSQKLKDIDQKTTLMKCWYGHSKCGSYFNNGFMYINCKMWRNMPDIIVNILNYYLENHDDIKFMNQSCYKYLITGKYKNLCIVENDELINVFVDQNTIIDKNVHIFHGCGRAYKLDKINNCFNQIVE